jgi:hypothetical protein
MTSTPPDRIVPVTTPELATVILPPPKITALDARPPDDTVIAPLETTTVLMADP